MTFFRKISKRSEFGKEDLMVFTGTTRVVNLRTGPAEILAVPARPGQVHLELRAGKPHYFRDSFFSFSFFPDNYLNSNFFQIIFNPYF